MKKLAITIGCTVAVAGAAFAQGTIQWENVAGNFNGATNGTAYSSFEAQSGALQTTTGVTVGSATAQYYYELLTTTTATSVPTTVSGLSAWTDTTLEAENGAGANGRITQLNSSSDAVASGWAAGATQNFILVGWSANLGTSWSTVLNELQNWSSDFTANAYFDVSSMGTLASGTANPGPLLFGSTTGQINDTTAGSDPMTLNLLGTVPEPTSLALAAMGGASLLLFRRKK